MLAVCFLIAATGVFVAAEFALVATDRSKIESTVEEGSRRARWSMQLLRRLSFNLSGAQLGITVASLLLGFAAEPTLAALIEPVITPFVDAAAVHGFAVAMALIVATYFEMVLGELVPKNLAIAKPEATTLALAPLIRIYGQLFGPVITILDKAANRTVRALGIEPKEELSTVRTLPELALVIEASAEEGMIGGSASRLLARSIRFTRKTAADVLIPRVEVKAIRSDATVHDLVALAAETGHSRFPVMGADLDDIVGVVHVHRVHALGIEARETTPVSALMSEVMFVPESRELQPLLVDMRSRRQHLAVVVDEYGGTAGIVTLEDLVEEIVGEIDDEYDILTPRLTAVPAPSGGYYVPGVLHP
ncbi:MAG: hemolysin family protein, partial [Acidimicrobiales bacterium]|nr:hemolysin family protein [Acidimicrobiales bacterium]